MYDLVTRSPSIATGPAHATFASRPTTKGTALQCCHRNARCSIFRARFAISTPPPGAPCPSSRRMQGAPASRARGSPGLIDPAHPAAQYERARRAAARLINADADDVALISSVSYGVATAAKLVTVPARSRVLVLENDHSSAVLEGATPAPSRRVPGGGGARADRRG